MKFELKSYNRNVTDEEILEDLRQVATKFGSITEAEYGRVGKFSIATIGRRFGGWIKALSAAGLSQKSRFASDEELLENIEQVWLTLGRQPGRRDLRQPLSKFSERPYRDRYGTWLKALEKFVEVANSETANLEGERVTQANSAIRELPGSNDIRPGDNLVECSVELQESAPTIRSAKIRNVKPQRTKRDINWRLRFRVLSRDNYRCVSCGLSPAIAPGTILHVDHIKPWSKGGETVLENLQTLCATCNLGKGNFE